MLVDHYRDTVTVNRRSVTDRKTTFAEVATVVPCHIQPVEANTNPGQAGRGERTFLIFTDYALQNGDHVVDSAAVTYEVSEVMVETWRGKQHVEASLRTV